MAGEVDVDEVALGRGCGEIGEGGEDGGPGGAGAALDPVGQHADVGHAALGEHVAQQAHVGRGMVEVIVRDQRAVGLPAELAELRLVDLLEQLIAHVLVENFLSCCSHRIPNAVREFANCYAARLEALQCCTVVCKELCEVPAVRFCRCNFDDLLVSR